MPWNAGVYTRAYASWTNDANNNLPISATKFDLEDNDFAAGLNNCITIDGLNRATANIPPKVDNTYSLGTPLLAWSNLYLGPNHAPVLDPTSGNVGYYARTAAEISAGVTPSNFSYAPLNVLRYGADPTGAADSTTAIQNAINVAAAATGGGGGLVYLPPGLYTIGTAGTGLVVSNSNVQLIGAGSGYLTTSAAFPVPNSTTTLQWGGVASLPAVAMIAFTSPSGASNWAIRGCGASGLQLNCNSFAGFGIQLTSVKKGVFGQLSVLNPITAAYQLTTLLNANLQDTDTQHCTFTQCLWRCIDTAASKKAHGFWLTNAAPTGVNGNSSFNTFLECVGDTDGTTAATSGQGIRIDQGDNNSFINCIAYRTGGTTVPSVLLNGNTGSSDGNLFYHFSDTTAVNAINIRGNATLGTGYNPVQNMFIGVDANNGVNYPTMDAGCRVYWLDSNGITISPVSLGHVIGQPTTNSATLAQVANVTNESLRIYNVAQNHLLITDGSGVWGINIDGSENLRFSSLGSASGLMTGPSLQLTGRLGVSGNSPPAQVTGWGTPTGASVQNNFAGASATLAQTSAAVAKIITDLKAIGFYGA